MYTRNKQEPKTGPCGTPNFTRAVDEKHAIENDCLGEFLNHVREDPWHVHEDCIIGLYVCHLQGINCA